MGMLIVLIIYGTESQRTGLRVKEHGFTWMKFTYCLTMSIPLTSCLSFIKEPESGGVPTGITQNVEDLLRSELARRMLSNSDFIMMLNQAPSDRAELAKLLNISDNQLSYVTNSEAGQGLLFCGNSIIPFKDKFEEH